MKLDLGYDPQKLLMQATADIAYSDVVKKIKLTELTENSDNFYQINDIEALAESIKVDGQLMPIEVSNRSNLIISGHRRFNALKLLGEEFANVVYKEFDSEEEEQLYLIRANSYRKKSKEETEQEILKLQKYYQKLKEEQPGLSININKLIAKEVGVGITKVKETVKPKEKKEKEEKSSLLISAEEKLIGRLETDVRLKGNNKGTITIKYYSEKELTRILDLININED